jgi:predicted nucleic acid-binding Zn ribbon protein
MKRRAPRPFAAAIESFTADAAPASLLAKVQAAWPGVAGSVMTEEAEPVSERAGVVTFNCRSATWANELDLLSADLVERLNGALGTAGPGPVTGLRFRVGGAISGP